MPAEGIRLRSSAVEGAPSASARHSFLAIAQGSASRSLADSLPWAGRGSRVASIDATSAREAAATAELSRLAITCARIIAALAGAAVLPVGAAWHRVGGELVFRVEWFGRLLWSGDAAAFAVALARVAPFLWLLALLAGLIGASAYVHRIGRRPVFVVGAAVVAFLALAPFVPGFVAVRQPGSATAYLDIEDLVHGLGWALLLWSVLAGQPRVADAGEIRGDAQAKWAAAAAALLVLVGSEFGLGGQSLTNDEVSYRYQAELFARGELARHTSFPASFPARQVALVSDGWGTARAFSKYPPGHSLALAPFVRVGALGLAAPLLAALAVLLAAQLARQLGARRPGVAAWLVALSPLFLASESLGLSHSTSLVMTTAFALCALRALDSDGEARRYALLAGFALSFALATRPVTALAVALPFAIFGARAGARGARLAGIAVVGALPGLLLFLWVNHVQTGSALKTAYDLYADLCAPEDRYPYPGWRETALANTGYALARLGVWLHGPALSLLLPVAGFALVTGRCRFLCAAVPVALLAAYAVHWFAGLPWAGPIYLVEALPFLAVLSANGIDVLLPGRAAQRVALVCALVASAQLLGRHLGSARERIAERQAPYRAVRERGVERGVVFVRLCVDDAKLYPLPPPDPAAQLVFAADAGADNKGLRASLGNPPAFIFDPATGALEEVR